MNVATLVRRLNNFTAQNHLENFINLVPEADACIRAAEIYQCGQDKDPALVSALQGRLTDNTSATYVCLSYIVSKLYL
jgi:hypothetical protein